MRQPSNRNDRRSTAFHEAGHAVAAILTGIPFEKVYVVKEVDHASRPVGQKIGEVVRHLNKPDLAGKGEEEARRQVLMAFAGPYGETFAYPGLQPFVPQEDGDIQGVMGILRFIFCEFTMKDGQAVFSREELTTHKVTMERLLNEGSPNAARFCAEHAATITKVAEALLRDHELSFDQVVALCKG